jgi:hypothetical protein
MVPVHCKGAKYGVLVLDAQGEPVAMRVRCTAQRCRVHEKVTFHLYSLRAHWVGKELATLIEPYRDPRDLPGQRYRSRPDGTFDAQREAGRRS